jgi:restriction system protein
MGRRKQGAIEDVIEITSMLPWWVGAGLAVASYIALHQMAVIEIAAPTGGVGIGDFVGKQMYKAFATYLQYIVPALLLIGAAVSAFKMRSRRALHGEVAAAGVKSALERMSWKQF